MYFYSNKFRAGWWMSKEDLESVNIYELSDVPELIGECSSLQDFENALLFLARLDVVFIGSRDRVWPARHIYDKVRSRQFVHSPEVLTRTAGIREKACQLYLKEKLND